MRSASACTPGAFWRRPGTLCGRRGRVPVLPRSTEGLCRPLGLQLARCAFPRLPTPRGPDPEHETSRSRQGPLRDFHTSAFLASALSHSRSHARVTATRLASSPQDEPCGNVQRRTARAIRGVAGSGRIRRGKASSRRTHQFRTYLDWKYRVVCATCAALGLTLISSQRITLSPAWSGLYAAAVSSRNRSDKTQSSRKRRRALAPAGDGIDVRNRWEVPDPHGDQWVSIRLRWTSAAEECIR